MPSPIILPYISLQPDFANVLAEVRDGTIIAEDIYLSGYKTGSTSVHGKVNVYAQDGNREPILDSREGVDLKRLDAHGFTASVPALGIADAILRVPRQTLSFNPEGSHKVRRISSFDVSPDASLVAAGHLDGEVSIQSATGTGSTAVPLKRNNIHLSTVLSIRFFPSSKVLLSASADLSLNIISADPSPDASFPLLSVARTLKGHKSAVTDTHIVGVGKTVYSSGKDGSIRLWDVGQASKVGSTLMSEAYNPILRIAVLSAANTESANGGGGGEGYIVHAALQNGTFNVFDTRTENLVYASPPERRSPALLSIASDASTNTLVTGSATGVVEVYDTRQLSSTQQAPSNSLYSFKRSDASIDDLLFTPSASSLSPSLLVATGDGFPYRLTVPLGGEKPQVVEEYAAHADEGVRSIRTSSKSSATADSNVNVWTAGDDGLARRY